MRFRAKIELGGKTATGMEIPAKVVTALGKGKRPPVKVTINGYTYRTTVAPMGGRFMLPLSADNREGAHAKAGDTVELDVELDSAPREVDMPKDLAAALAKDKQAKSFFDSLSFTNKNTHVQGLLTAKTDETRRRRLAKSMDQLRSGKK